MSSVFISAEDSLHLNIIIMSLYFEKYAAKGNEFVHMLAEDLEVKPEVAFSILRAVLHALRNRLSVEVSFRFLAQLPMALKSVYVDGWTTSSKFKRIKHLQDFLEEVRLEYGAGTGFELSNHEKARKALKAVFKALNFYVGEGETVHLTAVFPNELKSFVLDAIGSNQLIL